MTSDHGDLELAVLAAVSSDRYLFSKAVEEGFRAELFYLPAARLVGSTLLALCSQPGISVDLLVLKSKLEENGLLTPQVAECLEALRNTPAPQLDQLVAYLEILKDRETRARLLKLADRIAQYAHGQAETETSVADFTAKAFEGLLEIQRDRVRRRVRPVADMVRQIVSESNARPKGEQALLGYSVEPFDRLTRTLSGLRSGFYYGLAGAPRRGKKLCPATCRQPGRKSSHPGPFLLLGTDSQGPDRPAHRQSLRGKPDHPAQSGSGEHAGRIGPIHKRAFCSARL